MLITFYTKAHADIVLVGKPAEKIFSMLNYGNKIPGAIRAEDVPQALNNLKKGIASHEALIQENQQQVKEKDGAEDDRELPVSLTTRAFPVIELLEAAVRDGEYVSWK